MSDRPRNGDQKRRGCDTWDWMTVPTLDLVCRLGHACVEFFDLK
jgi:hypothetical protein